MGQQPKCQLRNKKLLEENGGEFNKLSRQQGFVVVVFGSVVDSHPKSKGKKRNYTNRIIIRLKSIFASKETISSIKGQTAEWEKMFAHHLSDEEVIFRIYQELNMQQENLIFFKEEKLSE